MHPVVKKLLAWYRIHRRTLPWREAFSQDSRPDAYRIFISELMLQQTQVDRVIPLFDAFLKRFPSWQTLAHATTADLIHAWAGLGYNRRALYAREAAKEVLRSGVPHSEDDWRRLKGVGPYMAAALAEFVNHHRAIVIDTNVRRVAGRAFLGIHHPTPEHDKPLRNALEETTPQSGRHWEFPQAFMDLGSAICAPRTPDCRSCPLQHLCPVASDFLTGNAPSRRRTAPAERIHDEKPFPDRIYRGRMLAHVRMHGPTSLEAVGTLIDNAFDPIADADWLRAMAGRLVKDGLLRWSGRDTISLPHS